MVFSLLKKLFKDSPPEKKSSPRKEQPLGKHFKYLICDDEEELPLDTWYCLERWRRPHFLKIDCDWSEDWEVFSLEEEVVGFTHELRSNYFLIMGDQPDFKIFLERERDNPVNPNAIKVMGSATVEDELMAGQLGYLSKETAELLKDAKELDARPRLAELPYKDRYYGLSITVLVRP